MSLRDRVRVEIVVQRLGWWLDWKRMPRRRRREVLRELRANLADAAAADELDAAIARLGPPRVVAEEYVDFEAGGLRWRAGWFAALVAYTVVTWLTLAAAIGFAEGVQAAGAVVGETYDTGHSLAIGDGALLSFRESEQGFSFHLPLIGWPQVAAAVLAFVAFARPWRAVAGRRAARAPR